MLTSEVRYNYAMDDLRVLRDKLAEIEAEETRLLRRMTVAESLHEARVLYDAYVLADRACLI
jgi:hypothetical protein